MLGSEMLLSIFVEDFVFLLSHTPHAVDGSHPASIHVKTWTHGRTDTHTVDYIQYP